MHIFAALTISGGAAALFFTFSEKSEAKNAAFGGYSLSRWALGLGTAILLAAFVLLFVHDSRSGGRLRERIRQWLSAGDRAWFAFWICLGGLYLSLW